MYPRPGAVRCLAIDDRSSALGALRWLVRGAWTTDRMKGTGLVKGSTFLFSVPQNCSLPTWCRGDDRPKRRRRFYGVRWAPIMPQSEMQSWGIEWDVPRHQIRRPAITSRSRSGWGGKFEVAQANMRWNNHVHKSYLYVYRLLKP